MPTNPAVRAAIDNLVDSLSTLGSDNLETLTAAAKDAIMGADYASITLVHDDGSVETLAPTDTLIVRVDQLQAEYREGPCYDAATEDEMFIAEDLAHDERWPRYAPAAVDLGIAAQMGIDLHHPGKDRAALNLYSVKPYVFVTELETAQLFASHAALALGYATVTDDYEAALASRKTIGQALGIVMERYQINEDKAFKFLVRISQHSNVKVREVAADIGSRRGTARRRRCSPPARRPS
jgi:hypothetical protein